MTALSLPSSEARHHWEAVFHRVYDDVVRFASTGPLAQELFEARADYIKRTGELFESDAWFERRIVAFLEWYVLDRSLQSAPDKTPVALYLERELGQPEDRVHVEALRQSTSALFELLRARPEHLIVRDLLSGTKYTVHEPQHPFGMESGDIFEARVVPFEGTLRFSEAVTLHPRSVRRIILKALKKFRKSAAQDRDSRMAMVHRVTFLTNRCERYRHMEPRQIFAELIS